MVTSAAADFGGGNVLTPGGSSGIRTTNMTSATPTLAGNGKVVTVNANGDFYLAPDGGSGGTVTPQAQNGLNTSVAPPFVEIGGSLIRPTAVDQNSNNIVWNGNGQFGIGNGLPNALGFFNPNARFELNNNNMFYSMYLRHTTNGVGIDMDVIGNGVINAGQALRINGAQTNIGIDINATSPQNGSLFSNGITARALYGQEVYGGLFYATSDNTSVYGYGTYGHLNYNSSGNYFFRHAANGGLTIGQANGTKYGVIGAIHFSNDDRNVGVGGCIGPNGLWAPNICNGTTVRNIAVYGGFVSSQNPNFSASSSSNFAGYFDGNVEITGQLTINGVVVPPSDLNLKTNIDSMGSVKNILTLLKPKEFYYDTTRFFLAHNNKKQYGFIAQEVETVLPELVSNYSVADRVDTLGNVIAAGGTYKNLNYNALLAFLVRGMQEQQKTIDSLVNGNQQQNRAPGSNHGNEDAQEIKESAQKNITKSNITLSDADALVLDQNQPNPFNESTLIKFNVPQKYAYAQLIFTTEDGRIIKTVDVSKKGRNELTVYANDLSSGIYHYTLVVDGKTIDTKKMVKQ